MHIGTPKSSALDWRSSVDIAEQGTGGLTSQGD